MKKDGCGLCAASKARRNSERRSAGCVRREDVKLLKALRGGRRGGGIKALLGLQRIL